MKFAEPHHAELISTIYRAYVSYDGLMPDQEAPCYKGLSQCWGWHGATSNGYACMRVGNWSYLGHRVSYFLHHGEIQTSMVVRHRCDNKICTNPDHLQIGTHAENMNDIAERRDFMSTVESNLKSKGTLKRVKGKVQEMLDLFFLHEVVFCGRHCNDSPVRMSQDWERLGKKLRSFGMEIAAEANPKFQSHLVDEDEPFIEIDYTKPQEESFDANRYKKYMREYMRSYRKKKALA